MSRYVQNCTADQSPNLSRRKQLQVLNILQHFERRHSWCVLVNLLNYTKERLEAHRRSNTTLCDTAGRIGWNWLWQALLSRELALHCTALNIWNWLWHLKGTRHNTALWCPGAALQRTALVGLAVKPRSHYWRHAALGKTLILWFSSICDLRIIRDRDRIIVLKSELFFSSFLKRSCYIACLIQTKNLLDNMSSHGQTIMVWVLNNSMSAKQQYECQTIVWVPNKNECQKNHNVKSSNWIEIV